MFLISDGLNNRHRTTSVEIQGVWAHAFGMAYYWVRRRGALSTSILFLTSELLRRICTCTYMTPFASCAPLAEARNSLDCQLVQTLACRWGHSRPPLQTLGAPQDLALVDNPDPRHHATAHTSWLGLKPTGEQREPSITRRPWISRSGIFFPDLTVEGGKSNQLSGPRVGIVTAAAGTYYVGDLKIYLITRARGLARPFVSGPKLEGYGRVHILSLLPTPP